MSPEPTRPSQPRGAATRARLTRSAARLMRRRGYHATGLNDVVAHSHAPKGSLYHFFPRGKEQLASEAVTESTRIVTGLIVDAFAVNPDLTGVLRAFAELLGTNLTRSDFRDGCPVATITLDAASDSELIRQACSTSFIVWRDTIAGELARRGHPDVEAVKLATLVLSAFEGALVMARALRDVQPLHDVADILSHRLEGAR